MIQPNDRVLQAMVALGNNAAFSVVVDEFLQPEFDAQTKQCITQIDDTALRQAQGRAQSLVHFLGSYRTARETLAKRDEQKPKGTAP